MEGSRPVIIKEKSEMRNWSRAIRSQGKTIGFVPTMGYLHEGHLSLVREARKLAEVVVVSIYLNPSQFAPNEDFATYPSDFHGDVLKLKSIPGGVDAIFHPENLYDHGNTRSVTNEGAVSCLDNMGMGHETWVRVEKLEKGLCGESRPVFFRGVATVVVKLFNVVEPDVAVFGKKDYQQWRILRRMVRDLDFGVEVVGSEIVRDTDGLALSSRNVRLSAGERNKALSICRSLQRAKVYVENGIVSCKEIKDSATREITEAGGKIDYAEIVSQENLEPVGVIEEPVVFCIAAWFGEVRLIDNIEMKI